MSAVTPRALVTFTARYPSSCASCYQRIHEGDEVCRPADGGLEHVSCPPTLSDTPVIVCTTCWCAKPCWCDGGDR